MPEVPTMQQRLAHSLAIAASSGLDMKEVVAAAAARSCCLAAAASAGYCFTTLRISFANLTDAASSALPAGAELAPAAAAWNAAANWATPPAVSAGLALRIDCSADTVCSFQPPPAGIAAAPGSAASLPPAAGPVHAAASASGSSCGGRLALSVLLSSSA